jgi:hypothetical protein
LRRAVVTATISHKLYGFVTASASYMVSVTHTHIAIVSHIATTHIATAITSCHIVVHIATIIALRVHSGITADNSAVLHFGVHSVVHTSVASATSATTSASATGGHDITALTSVGVSAVITHIHISVHYACASFTVVVLVVVLAVLVVRTAGVVAVAGAGITARVSVG